MPLTLFLIVNLFFYGFTLWLGGYLIARNSQKTTVTLTG
jgi:cell division protein FtsB